MTSLDRHRVGRPLGKFQTLHIEGGGHGFVLVDLDTPIPRPDPIWLQQQLAHREVECEYPGCTDLAVTYIELPRVHTPFVCKSHELGCTHHISEYRVRTRRVLMDAMLDEILLTGYGRRIDRDNPPNVSDRMNLPLVAAPAPRPTPIRDPHQPVTITTFNRPKLGQN